MFSFHEFCSTHNSITKKLSNPIWPFRETVWFCVQVLPPFDFSPLQIFCERSKWVNLSVASLSQDFSHVFIIICPFVRTKGFTVRWSTLSSDGHLFRSNKHTHTQREKTRCNYNVRERTTMFFFSNIILSLLLLRFCTPQIVLRLLPLLPSNLIY